MSKKDEARAALMAAAGDIHLVCQTGTHAEWVAMWNDFEAKLDAYGAACAEEAVGAIRPSDWAAEMISQVQGV